MTENDTFALPAEQTETTVAPPFIEESFPQVDPHQVEQQLIGQFKEMQEDMPAHDVAAHFFQMYYPVYRQLLGGLSNKDARRVAEHVVQWPLEDENPKFNDEKAKQAFQVGIRLVDCKMIMKTFVEMERHQELLALKAEQDAAKAAAEQQTGETVIQPTEEVVIQEEPVEQETPAKKQGERKMANKYTQVGTIWKGKPNKNGEEMPHSLKFKEGFVPHPNGWLQFHSQKWKAKDLEQKLAKGWVKEEEAERKREAIANMNADVIAEIWEVVKQD